MFFLFCFFPLGVGHFKDCQDIFIGATLGTPRILQGSLWKFSESGTPKILSNFNGDSLKLGPPGILRRFSGILWGGPSRDFEGTLWACLGALRDS